MELKELLNQVQPDRPRQRVTMPIQIWIDEYLKAGFVSIPIYMSVKSSENPEGFRWSKIRSILTKGHSNLDNDLNEQVIEVFKEAFFTISKNAKTKHRFSIVVPASQVSSMRDGGYYLKPLNDDLSGVVITPIKLSVETTDKVSDTGTSDEQTQKPKVTQKSNLPKSKKKK